MAVLNFHYKKNLKEMKKGLENLSANFLQFWLEFYTYLANKKLSFLNTKEIKRSRVPLSTFFSNVGNQWRYDDTKRWPICYIDILLFR